MNDTHDSPAPTPARSKAGYSLVEVTLALLVVAIGLTSTFSLFPEAMKNTRTAVSDTEVALFADYVFSTLAVGAARYGGYFSDGQTDRYASLVLAQSHLDAIRLRQGFGQFYWIPEDDDMGTGDWDLAEDAGYWSTAFSYELTFDQSPKGSLGSDTIYATLKVWPGEWKSKPNEEKFKPYVFYREILPYPNL